MTRASILTGGSWSRSRPTRPGPMPQPRSTRNDPRTRGIVVLGLDAPEAELAASFALAAKQPLVKGFAVGRTIFGNAARAWMSGKMTDDEAISEMTENYARLCGIWDKARKQAMEDAA